MIAQLRQFASREEWLAVRGLGGSEVAAIRGRSPWASPWDVWVRRQPGVEDRTPESAIQAEGRRYERIVVGEYEVATGRVVEPIEHLVMVHPEFPWASGSPDGFVDGRSGGLEAKTYRTDAGDWGPSGTVIEQWSPEADEVVPAYYLDQAYWYLEISGLPWWDVAVWLPRSWGFPELRWYRVLADRAHQRRMLLEVGLWRERHLVGGVPLDADDSEACRRWQATRKAPTHKRVREASEREAELVAHLHWARAQRDALTAEVRRTESELGELFGADTYGVRIRGLKCLRVRSRTRAEVDMDRVRAVCPDAIREGREFHRFNLYPVKES